MRSTMKRIVMPYLPNKPCPRSGCPALILHDQRFCADHQAEANLDYNHNRRPARHRFYGTWEWKRFRGDVLKERGSVCYNCGCTYGPIELDHIIPLADRPDLKLDRDNVMVLCGTCHRHKTGQGSPLRTYNCSAADAINRRVP